MYRSICLLLLFLSPATTLIIKAQTLNCQKGKANFRSEAPLELISAQSDEVKGKIDPLQQTFAFSIRSESFKGFNSSLQREHFNENYIESPKYKASTFAGKFIDKVDFTKKGVMAVKVKGKLNIHGVEKERIIKADIEIKDNQIIVKSKFTVLLVDHNISIPKIVFQKIAEEINVSIDAIFIK
jgi:hypothetical protein